MPTINYQHLFQLLTQIVGERITVKEQTRKEHGGGFSYHAICAPDMVIYPVSTAEISSILHICSAYQVPIIPYGAGTSVEGHVAALNGGVCLDLSYMNHIIQVNEQDGNVVVEAGVTRKQLDAALANTDYFFPIGPEIDATLGGMAATRASGTNAVRYGTMRDNVLSMKVVLQNGQIIQTGAAVKKSSAGYDLTRLFIGSEGTLGIITELTLKLYSRPEKRLVAVASFPAVNDAVNTCMWMMRKGFPIAKVELLDAAVMEAVNAYDHTHYPIAPALFMEFHGTEFEMHHLSDKLALVVNSFNGFHFETAIEPAAITALWKARANVAPALLASKPGTAIFGTDVCVPVSQLADCIEQTQNDIIASGLVAPILGHIGDGNFHLAILIDPDNTQEIATAKKLSDQIVHRALSMGGTCTGEHGIGFGKLSYMPIEHKEALEVMRRIKQALDPDNLMNPGKLVPMQTTKTPGAGHY